MLKRIVLVVVFAALVAFALGYPALRAVGQPTPKLQSFPAEGVEQIIPEDEGVEQVTPEDGDLVKSRLQKTIEKLRSRIGKLEEEIAEVREFKTVQDLTLRRRGSGRGRAFYDALADYDAALKKELAAVERKLHIAQGEITTYTAAGPVVPQPTTSQSTSPRTSSRPSQDNIGRYSIHAIKKSTILLDTATGDTWKLKDDEWVRIEKAGTPNVDDQIVPNLGGLVPVPAQ